MASTRVLVLVALLACTLLLLIQPAESAPAPAAAPSGAAGAGGKCDPSNKTCHPADPHAPENQEEEAASVNVKVPLGLADDDDYNDDELPSLVQDHVILGH